MGIPQRKYYILIGWDIPRRRAGGNLEDLVRFLEPRSAFVAKISDDAAGRSNRVRKG